MARQRESSHLLVSISLESSVVFITDTNSLAYVWSPSFSYSAPPRARRLQRWDISHGAEEYHNVLIDSSAALLLFRELPLSAPMSYLNIKSPLCKCSKNLSQFIKKKEEKTDFTCNAANNHLTEQKKNLPNALLCFKVSWREGDRGPARIGNRPWLFV